MTDIEQDITKDIITPLQHSIEDIEKALSNAGRYRIKHDPTPGNLLVWNLTNLLHDTKGRVRTILTLIQ